MPTDSRRRRSTEQPTGPQRDSAQSRERLLRAAGKLFAERGFDRTTTRDLGDEAATDPALIARYFGGKTGLYLAALRAELGDGAPPDLLEPGRMSSLLTRLGRLGPGPVFRSVLVPHENEEVQAAANESIRVRLIRPLEDRYERAGLDRCRLRAELAVAAFVGVVTSRTSRTLSELAEVSDSELADLLSDLLGLAPAAPRR